MLVGPYLASIALRVHCAMPIIGRCVLVVCGFLMLYFIIATRGRVNECENDDSPLCLVLRIPKVIYILIRHLLQSLL